MGIQTSWKPNYLGVALFAQGNVWVTAAGVEQEIVEMDSRHLLNTLCFLERVAKDIHKQLFGHRFYLVTDDPAKWMVGTPLYKAIKAEIEHRMNVPSLRQIERHFTVVVANDDMVYIKDRDGVL